MVTAQGECVTFRFFRRDAGRVYLVGDFNGWGRQPLPMVSTGDGYWTAAVRLSAGEHHFQYLVEGLPCPDPAAVLDETGPHGPDSVVQVFSRATEGGDIRPLRVA